MGIVSGILGFISKPLETVLDKLLPNKEQKDQFKHEFQMAILNLPMEERKMFETRVLKEIENPNMLRDAVRPIITYVSFALYTYVKITTIYFLTKIYFPLLEKMTDGPIQDVYANLDNIKEMLNEFIRGIFTEWDVYIFLTILGFWFGSKLLERTIDKVAKTGGVAGVFMGIKKGFLSSVASDMEEEEKERKRVLKAKKTKDIYEDDV